MTTVEARSREFLVQGSEATGYVDDEIPIEAITRSAQELGSPQDVEDEIDLMLAAIRKFWSQEPDQVMRTGMALSARATELYVHLHRVEGKLREFRQIRTQQIVPLLSELDRQFRAASRMLESRRQDIELTK